MPVAIGNGNCTHVATYTAPTCLLSCWVVVLLSVHRTEPTAYAHLAPSQTVLDYTQTKPSKTQRGTADSSSGAHTLSSCHSSTQMLPACIVISSVQLHNHPLRAPPR